MRTYPAPAPAQRRAVRRRSPASCAGLTVLVDGESIYYRLSGSVEDREHTLVCLHGIGGSSRCWEDLLPLLGASAYTVAVDLPGHGQSDGAGAAEVGPYRRFLERFLAAAGIVQRVVLFGHCLGAAVALDFAAQYPERVAGLILVGAGARLRLGAGALEAARRGDTPAQFLDGLLAPGCALAAVQAARSCWLATRPEVRYLDLVAASRFDFAAAAAGVKAPGLLLTGAGDAVAPAEAVREMAARWPASRLQVLPGCAHLPMLEQPVAVAQAVRHFLAGVRPLRPVVAPAW